MGVKMGGEVVSGGAEAVVDAGGAAVVRLVTDRDVTSEEIISILERALSDAQGGKLGMVPVFRILRSGERVISYSADDRTLAIGALMQAAMAMGSE